MKKKKKMLLGIFISILLAITAIIISLSSTSALFIHKDTSTVKNNYNTGILSITAISKSDKISLDNTLPMTDVQGAAQDPYIFTIKNNGNVDYQFDVQLLSTGEAASTFDPQYIKLKVDNAAVTTLSSLTNSKIKTGLTLGAQQTVDISIRVWLASNTPNTQIGKSFTSQLVINGIAVSPTTNYGVSAAAYVTNLYNNAAKTVVTNNSIDYNYATSVSLMNDRLGGTTKDLNAGNIRYYGSNPNNYIWLGETYTTACSAEVCGTARQADDKKLYRIIGVFDNMLKVVSVDSIGKYSWDSSANDVNSGGGVNEWTQADVMKLLNDNYDLESVNNSLYWNKLGNGSCYTGQNNTVADCSFANNGLSKTARSKIADVTWHLGGHVHVNDYSDVLYSNERSPRLAVTLTDSVVRRDTWVGKVGLIYNSDYGYGADFRECEVILSSYSSSDCTSNNWLKISSSYFWTISAYAQDSASTAAQNSYNVYYVQSTGSIVCTSSAGAANIYPSFYLNAEVRIASGSGTSVDPYVIK